MREGYLRGQQSYHESYRLVIRSAVQGAKSRERSKSFHRRALMSARFSAVLLLVGTTYGFQLAPKIDARLHARVLSTAEQECSSARPSTFFRLCTSTTASLLR